MSYQRFSNAFLNEAEGTFVQNDEKFVKAKHFLQFVDIAFSRG
jgi:hypothetical protein